MTYLASSEVVLDPLLPAGQPQRKPDMTHLASSEVVLDPLLPARTTSEEAKYVIFGFL